MLDQWLRRALAASGLKQAELARKLADALGRSIDRAAIHKMTIGTRRLNADEMLEAARICDYPLPINAAGDMGEFTSAMIAIGSTMSRADRDAQAVAAWLPKQSDDILEITAGDLRFTIAAVLAYEASALEPAQIESLAESILTRILNNAEVSSSRRYTYQPETVKTKKHA